MRTHHTPVFLKEAVYALDIKKNEQYIDATYGEGGHAREIVRNGGLLLAIDADIEQVNKDANTFKIVHGNFADIQEIAKQEGCLSVSGILFDFGLSMRQVREGGKGFSFENLNDSLDMRLSDKGMSASDYLNNADHETLQHDLMKYSEDIHSKEIANKIIQQRSVKAIETVQDLLHIVDTVVQRNMMTRRKTYARIFQALRIVINNEIENIKKALNGALNITKTDGKIVVITFHSIEDRVVKSFARSKSEYLIESIVDVGRNRQLAQFERSAVLRVLTII